MEAIKQIPMGLETLVQVSYINLAFVGTASGVFLYFIAGPMGLIIPTVLVGIFTWFFRRKK